MPRKWSCCLLIVLLLVATMHCSQKENEQPAPEISPETAVLKIYPMDSMAGLISQTDDRLVMEIDPEISSDGNGSLRIDATGSATVHLYQAGDLDVENARLTYRARLRTENVSERVYLELWCHFPEAGEFYSRGLAAALSGSNSWATVETPFLLKTGENPDEVKLNLVLEGSGTVWIDDIHLIRGPLQ